MTIAPYFALPGTQQARPTSGITHFEQHPDEFVMEPKYDGFRMLAHYDDGALEGYSRAHKVVGKGAGMAAMLPHIWYQLMDTVTSVTDHRHTVFDGELYVDAEDGYHARHHAHVASVMKSLPARARSLQGVHPDGTLDEMGTGVPLTYFVFDLLFLNGEDLRGLKWEARRELLEGAFAAQNDGHEYQVRVAPCSAPDQDVLDEMLRKGVEGCIIKRRAAPYVSWERPKDNWWKYKVDQTADVVCMGFTAGREGKGVRNMPDTFGAIVFGQYQETDEGLALVERGRASGMNDDLRFGYLDKSRGIDRTSELLGKVFEIRHNGIQNPGFRHPRFLWWRDDKRPEECTWD